jgi:Sulfotransferase family
MRNAALVGVSFMSEPAQPPVFFVHIMKTGGASLRQHFYANFEAGEVFPVPNRDDMDRAWLVDYLLDLPGDRRAQTRVYTGHFPFVASQLLGVDPVTLTILRHPVERTISYLKHCKRYHAQHRDLPLEEIYHDDFHFPCFIHNHQTKIFAMTTDDKLESYMDVIDVDDQRLETAKDNLEKVDVLGLHEQYDEFLEALRRRFGWRFERKITRRAGREDWEVSPVLRQVIAEDNAADIAFYEYGKRLHDQRRRTQVPS